MIEDLQWAGRADAAAAAPRRAPPARRAAAWCSSRCATPRPTPAARPRGCSPTSAASRSCERDRAGGPGRGRDRRARRRRRPRAPAARPHRRQPVLHRGDAAQPRGGAGRAAGGARGRQGPRVAAPRAACARHRRDAHAAAVLGRDFRLATLEAMAAPAGGGAARRRSRRRCAPASCARTPSAGRPLRLRPRARARDALRRARRRRAGRACTCARARRSRPPARRRGELAHHFFAARDVGGAEAARRARRRGGAAGRGRPRLRGGRVAPRAGARGARARADPTTRCAPSSCSRSATSAGRASEPGARAASTRPRSWRAARRAGSARPRRARRRRALLHADRARPRLIARLEEALAALGDADGAAARAAARRGWRSTSRWPSRRPRGRLGAEAVAMARAAGDDGALAAALMGRHAALLDIEHVEERLRADRRGGGGRRAARARRARRARAALAHLRPGRARARCGGGRARHARLEALAHELHQPLYTHAALAWRGVWAHLAGRFDEAERITRESLRSPRRPARPRRARSSSPSCSPSAATRAGSASWSSASSGWRGSPARSACVASPLPLMLSGRGDRAARVAYEAVAAAASRRCRPASSASPGSSASPRPAPPSATPRRRGADRPPRAARRPARADAFSGCWGSVRRFLGLLAATAGRPDEARAHLEAALELHRRSRRPCSSRAPARSRRAPAGTGRARAGARAARPGRGRGRRAGRGRHRRASRCIRRDARRSIGRPGTSPPLKPGTEARKPAAGRGPATECGVSAALTSPHAHLARVHARARRARQPRPRQPDGRRGGRPPDRDRARPRRLLLARRPGVPRRAAAARRCPTASPASTACTCASPRRCATSCRTSRAASSSSASTSCFAEFYFQAFEAPPPAPGSRRRGRRCSPAGRARILALQFAITGMNAHINNDLAHALVLTWREMGCGAGRDSPERRDYEKVNEILEPSRPRSRCPLSDDADRDVDTAVRDHRRLPRAVEHPPRARAGVGAGADHARRHRRRARRAVRRHHRLRGQSPARTRALTRHTSVQNFRLRLAGPMSPHVLWEGRRAPVCQPMAASGCSTSPKPLPLERCERAAALELEPLELVDQLDQVSLPGDRSGRARSGIAWRAVTPLSRPTAGRAQTRRSAIRAGPTARASRATTGGSPTPPPAAW